MALIGTARDCQPLLCVAHLIRLTKSRTSAIFQMLAILSFTAVLALPVSLSLSLPLPADWSTHVRVRELCMHKKQDGQEGKRIKGFQLSQVFIVATPGLLYQPVDRESEWNDFLSLACHFESFSQSHPSTKIKSYMEILHERSTFKDLNAQNHHSSPFKIFPAIPNSSQCKSGMMTSLGIAQSILLGEQLALAYYKLWSLNKDMALAQTVGDESLYQAATAVLYGLLHEKQFMRNHVQKLAKNFSLSGSDNFFNAQSDTGDNYHYFIKSSFEQEHHLFKDKSSPTMNKDILEHTFKFEISAKNVLSFSALKFCQNPASTLQEGVNSDDLEHSSKSFSIRNILSLSDGHNEYLSKDSVFQMYANSRTLPLRKFLKAWTLSSKSRRNPEINLVTADDLYLFTLLTSLNKTVSQHIPPVSRLIFEKFTFNSSVTPSSSQYKTTVDAGFSLGSNQNYFRDQFFRVLFNGRVVTREIGNCHSDPMVSLGLCSFPTILTALEGASGNFENRDEL